MKGHSDADKVREMLSGNKPGIEIQRSMAPVGVETELYYKPKDNVKNASVLLLLYQKEQAWHTVFIKRTSHIKDKHSGQISFPGGRVERIDPSLQDTALRETEEEIGVDRSGIKILGDLTPLHVYASNHMVYPFVGYLDGIPNFKVNPSEVHSVLPTRLDYFQNESILQTVDMNLRGHIIKEVPYYDLYGEVLWGATAMMMAEFLHLWKNNYE